jgi:hypothetical protein
MRNVALVEWWRMQSTDRTKAFKNDLFRHSMDDLIRETRKQPPPKKTGHLTFIGYLIAAILGGLFMAKLDQPKPVAVVATPTPTPASTPTPTVLRAFPVPVQTVPRARLVHLRPLGAVENNQMPDGRVLTTRYMGELSSAASLPTYGANLGDMWFTQNDGHAWVLAPLANSPGSVGWIDP